MELSMAASTSALGIYPLGAGRAGKALSWRQLARQLPLSPDEAHVLCAVSEGSFSVERAYCINGINNGAHGAVCWGGNSVGANSKHRKQTRAAK